MAHFEVVRRPAATPNSAISASNGAAPCGSAPPA